jgi:hypothetical protein
MPPSGQDVVDHRLERRGLAGRQMIGAAHASPVQHDQARERSHSPHEMGVLGHLPVPVHVGRKLGEVDEVGTIANDLIRDRVVATPHVLRIDTLHRSIIARGALPILDLVVSHDRWKTTQDRGTAHPGSGRVGGDVPGTLEREPWGSPQHRRQRRIRNEMIAQSESP